MSERMTDERLAAYDTGFSADKVVLLMQAADLLQALKAERDRVNDRDCKIERLQEFIKTGPFKVF